KPAAAELKGDIVTGLDRPLAGLALLQEADREEIFAAADFGEIGSIGRQQHPYQLIARAPVGALLEQAVPRHQRFGLGAFAQQAQYQGRCLLQRLQRAEPGLQLRAPLGGRLQQPVLVGGQVEAAGSAGDAGPLHDAVEQVVVLQFAARQASYRLQRSGEPAAVLQQRLQPGRVDVRVMAQPFQAAGDALQFLDEFAADIAAARQHAEDIQQRCDALTAVPWAVAVQGPVDFLEQELEPQQGAY